MVKPERIKKTSASKDTEGKVIYWMSRDQRFRDNWGFIFADELRKEHNTEMAVVFCLVDHFLEATERQYKFMIEGLEKLYIELYEKNIPFYLLKGDPVEELKKFIKEFDIKHLVYDFDPLRIKQKWQSGLTNSLKINIYEVDSHNIVPARKASDKKEFGAYTLRPRIHRQLEYFLDEFPEINKRSKTEVFQLQRIDFKKAMASLNINRDVKPVNWIKPGEKEAKKTLHNFIEKKLENYSDKRNDPNSNALSNLSPYLHFGQISAQRVALEVLKLPHKNENIDSFLEELIVRKELSDNYCLYNRNYDNLENIPDWAEKTIEGHRKDEREFIYSLEEFEKAETHENLWNAAQNEMVKSGKMHGYMRMYWAKKILEWSESPEEAMEIAIYLNDKYELDGRDPNGYVGCAWAIAGVHDRAWTERPVFGKIRYMNYNGAKRKFDVNTYIKQWNS